MPYKDPAAKQAYNREWAQRARDANPDEQRRRGRVYRERWLARHPDALLASYEKHREWLRAHPLEGCADSARRKIGITKVEYLRLRASYNGNCACCGEPCARPHLDHDHGTGVIRGFICPRCNRSMVVVDDATLLARCLAFRAAKLNT